MKKVFAIGDIHGSIELLENILQFWDAEKEQLIFLGDYVDRGPDSLSVIRKVMDLTKNEGAIALSGNHEQLFLKWLQYPEMLKNHYFNSKTGGLSTVMSFLNRAIDDQCAPELAQSIKNEYREEVNFLDNLEYYYHWGNYLFVHAGIDANVKDFKQSKIEDFMWIRDEFYHVPHQSKEVVVFGHTPTMRLNEDRSSKLWVSPCRKKIGIDGAGAISEDGRLHGVVFSENTSEIIVRAVSYEQQFESYTIQL